MDAKKCDRCGSYYSDSPAKPTVKLTDGHTKQFNSIGNSYYDCDLCQKCWNDFAKWWENK
jgi:hypothetical protein